MSAGAEPQTPGCWQQEVLASKHCSFINRQLDDPQRKRRRRVSVLIAHTLNYTSICFVTNKTKTEMEANLQGPSYNESLSHVEDFMLDWKNFSFPISQLAGEYWVARKSKTLSSYSENSPLLFRSRLHFTGKFTICKYIWSWRKCCIQY